MLDERGEAVIYGVGTYRQILKDANGNTIWDQPTVGSAGSGGAASEPYEIVVQNLDGSDLCDLSIIPELFSVAFITPDDPDAVEAAIREHAHISPEADDRRGPIV